MKIICSTQEYFDMHEVITAGCCWIGSGEGRKGNKHNKGKLVDLDKFRMATNMMGVRSNIEWEISND